jgi:hypothetical protein
MSALWKKIERIGIEAFPYHLDDDDVCYYARDYISEGGYAASIANQLIQNFKKPPNRRGLPEWRYKEQAIRQFAQEISSIQNIQDFLVTCIPSSKTRDSHQYDSRLEATLLHLKSLKPRVEIEFPLSFREDMVAAHLGGGRSIDSIYGNLQWAGLRSHINDIIVIDDVLTTGAHFKACQRKIVENVPDANVIGLFWAKTVWQTVQ